MPFTAYSSLVNLMLICKKKDVKYFKKQYLDINYMAKSYSPEYVNENLTILTEDTEITNKLFENKVIVKYYGIRNSIKAIN